MNTSHSKSSTFMLSFTHSLQDFLFFLSFYVSPLRPQHFYRPTLNHPHSFASLLTTSTTLYTWKTTNPYIAFCPFLQRHSTNPSHHQPLHPPQTMQIFSLHYPFQINLYYGHLSSPVYSGQNSWPRPLYRGSTIHPFWTHLRFLIELRPTILRFLVFPRTSAATLLQILPYLFNTTMFISHQNCILSPKIPSV